MADNRLSTFLPNRSVMGAKMLQRPAEPYLREQYPEVYGALSGLMGTAPDEQGSVLDPNTARARAGAEIGFPLGTALQMLPFAKPAAAGVKALGPTAGRMAEGYLQRQGLMPNIVSSEPVRMGIKPINLDEGIFKPELTMQEMLRVRDIPTVQRVQRSMDLVGEKKFQEMVESQFKKYNPTNQNQEAMLVESVTLDILGKANRDSDLLQGLPGLKISTSQQAALDLAQQRAALPIEQAMQIFDTAGLPNKGRDLIQSKAESLANQLRENGFNVDLQHSGSLAGPSSYLKIFDPQTGRSFTKDVRISGHSKGPFNTQSVLNVASDQELNNVISSAINMRETGVSKGMRQITDLENKAQEFIADGMKPKTAYKKARDFLDNQNNNQPVQQNNINSFIK